MPGVLHSVFLLHIINWPSLNVPVFFFLIYRGHHSKRTVFIFQPINTLRPHRPLSFSDPESKHREKKDWRCASERRTAP